MADFLVRCQELATVEVVIEVEHMVGKPFQIFWRLTGLAAKVLNEPVVNVLVEPLTLEEEAPVWRLGYPQRMLNLL
jgi:hypothetical protein